MNTILVIGSLNTDMVIQTEKIPKAGETVLGGDFFMNTGEKGANQAVAASRLGGKVTFIGKVGDDIFGENGIRSLKEEGIETSFVGITSEASIVRGSNDNGGQKRRKCNCGSTGSQLQVNH